AGNRPDPGADLAGYRLERRGGRGAEGAVTALAGEDKGEAARMGRLSSLLYTCAYVHTRTRGEKARVNNK
ncbi:MAG: hypothetical protein IKZ60_04815, partial [Bacteroidales bacterium]|nr:hypothetical protein [Bacteroidales bacterium]